MSQPAPNDLHTSTHHPITNPPPKKRKSKNPPATAATMTSFISSLSSSKLMEAPFRKRKLNVNVRLSMPKLDTKEGTNEESAVNAKKASMPRVPKLMRLTNATRPNGTQDRTPNTSRKRKAPNQTVSLKRQPNSARTHRDMKYQAYDALGHTHVQKQGTWRPRPPTSNVGRGTQDALNTRRYSVAEEVGTEGGAPGAAPTNDVQHSPTTSRSSSTSTSRRLNFTLENPSYIRYISGENKDDFQIEILNNFINDETASFGEYAGEDDGRPQSTNSVDEDFHFSHVEKMRRPKSGISRTAIVVVPSQQPKPDTTPSSTASSRRPSLTHSTTTSDDHVQNSHPESDDMAGHESSSECLIESSPPAVNMPPSVPQPSADEVTEPSEVASRKSTLQDNEINRITQLVLHPSLTHPTTTTPHTPHPPPPSTKPSTPFHRNQSKPTINDSIDLKMYVHRDDVTSRLQSITRIFEDKLKTQYDLMHNELVNEQQRHKRETQTIRTEYEQRIDEVMKRYFSFKAEKKQFDKFQQTRHKMKQQIHTLKFELEQVRGEMDRLNAQQSGLIQKLEHLMQDKQELQHMLRETQQERDELQEELDQERLDRDMMKELRKELDESKKKISKLHNLASEADKRAKEQREMYEEELKRTHNQSLQKLKNLNRGIEPPDIAAQVRNASWIDGGDALSGFNGNHYEDHLYDDDFTTHVHKNLELPITEKLKIVVRDDSITESTKSRQRQKRTKSPETRNYFEDRLICLKGHIEMLSHFVMGLLQTLRTEMSEGSFALSEQKGFLEGVEREVLSFKSNLSSALIVATDTLKMVKISSLGR